MSDQVKPDIIDGVPLCSDDCPSNDGKRCMVTGFRPDRHCEPELKAIIAQNESNKAELVRRTLADADSVEAKK